MVKNYIKTKSLKQEKRTAKELNGRTTPASGALANAKGDVKTDIFLTENKFTDKDKYKLDLMTWKKIENEAIREGLRTPMLQIDIQELQLVVLDINDMSSFAPKGYFSIGEAHYTSKKSLQLVKKDLLFLGLEEGSVYSVHFPDKILSIMEKNFFLNFLD